MKLNNLLMAAACLLAMGLTACTGNRAKEPHEIKVLYLGGQSEWADGEYGGPKKFATDEEYQQNIEERMAAFGDLLRTYFDSVTVMKAADYKAEMSDGYDVTIIDGKPPVLEEEILEQDENGRCTKYVKARYLPDNYTAATITIGSMAELVGSRLGSKNDWYCLCLDADAHHVQTNHPIFNGPFKTELTMVKKPTPVHAFGYQYMFDEKIPDSLMMWSVQTIGYEKDPLFSAGLVSRDEGYLDSPDAEFISSGVCAKSPEAVAIGRHGNFLTWGFIASPLNMTDEAKVVFANAVVYMAQFNGKAPIARKYNDRIFTRLDIRSKKFMASQKGYDDYIASQDRMKAQMQKTMDELNAKLKKGEKLDDYEKSVMEYAKETMAPNPDFEQYLKMFVTPEEFEKFGTDEAAYQRYYDEIAPYCCGGFSIEYDMKIDEDAKAWGIANNDKRILDKAITCLEKGEETERAQRILEHYTLCDFTTPADWRKWYNKYQDKLFFTESGGWFFLVNEPGAPGNDYSVLQKRQQKAETAESTQPMTDEPDAQNPVITVAKAKVKGDKTIEVTFRMNILKGYHIYKEIGKGDPYMPLKVTFDLPDGCKLKSETEMPAGKPYGDKGTTMYEGSVTFTKEITYTEQPASICATVSYQCCDASICFTPQDKRMDIKVE